MSEQENDFLSEYADEDKATETPDEPEQQAEAEKAETVEDKGEEKADETPTEEADETKAKPDTEAPTAPETHEEERVPLAALKAEREKRQRFEREKQELERQIAEAQEQQAEPKPEIWDDPDGFVNQRIQAVEQQLQGRFYAALEAGARESFPDYDEVFEVVQEEAQHNPAIRQEVLSAPNPALAAYKLGKRLQEFKKMQDPEAYKAKIKAEILAEIKAEKEAEAKRKKAVADAIPPDLSSSRSVKGEDVPASEDVFDNMF